MCLTDHVYGILKELSARRDFGRHVDDITIFCYNSNQVWPSTTSHPNSNYPLHGAYWVLRVNTDLHRKKVQIITLLNEGWFNFVLHVFTVNFMSQQIQFTPWWLKVKRKQAEMLFIHTKVRVGYRKYWSCDWRDETGIIFMLAVFPYCTSLPRQSYPLLKLDVILLLCGGCIVVWPIACAAFIYFPSQAQSLLSSGWLTDMLFPELQRERCETTLRWFLVLQITNI